MSSGIRSYRYINSVIRDEDRLTPALRCKYSNSFYSLQIKIAKNEYFQEFYLKNAKKAGKRCKIVVSPRISDGIILRQPISRVRRNHHCPSQ